MKFALEIEKGRSGLWFVSSPDLKGLLVAERSLEIALERVVPIGRELLGVMRDMAHQSERAIKQREAFEPVFGDAQGGHGS